jgi:hypothetical protein
MRDPRLGGEHVGTARGGDREEVEQTADPAWPKPLPEVGVLGDAYQRVSGRRPPLFMPGSVAPNTDKSP